MIEAVFEELDVKRQVFGELEGVVTDECLLATNTSALSVTAMGETLEHPERLVGMHFFNPVALMPLVEIVRTPETDDTALATAWAVADTLRKRPVLVNDAPGFVVNRLLTRMMLVVLESVERGNSVEEADAGVLMLGLPMAPSVLLQMVGEQVATHVRATLQAAFPDRFAINPDGPVRSVEEIRDAVLEALADEVGPPARGRRRRLAEGRRCGAPARRRLPVLHGRPDPVPTRKRLHVRAHGPPGLKRRPIGYASDCDAHWGLRARPL